MATTEQASLDDLMVAMDVVDTLRHRQTLVDRELDAEQRRVRLVEKLRNIYAAQGIEVTDAILEQGVLALEEDRFHYEPASGPQVWLAKLYVSRSRWLLPLVLVVVVLLALTIGRYLLFTYPDAKRLDALPTEIGQHFSRISQLAKNPSIVSDAKALVDSAAIAIDDDNLKRAESLSQQLKVIEQILQQTYDIRILSRPGEMSGVWRIPDANQNARNYYLIVEAIDREGNVVSVPIMSEENNQRTVVDRWGIRVPQRVFQQVAADKRDDGIIQNNRVGRKAIGLLEPEYLIETSGAAITQW